MKWILFANKLVPLIWQAVELVERLSKGKGRQKQDEAVTLVGVFLELTEGIVGRDLMNDAEIQAATREAIDAIVKLQNVITRVKGAVVR